MKNEINKFYGEAYKDTVENHLGTFRNDDHDYQKVMKDYCWKGLCQDKKIKPEDADKEAQALKAIDPEKDKDGFKKKLTELLDKNCEPDLKMIFEKYRTNKDCGIGEAVDKAFEVKRVKRAYNRLVRYIEDTCRFYADELHEAVDGCGTDTDRINRIVLTRCERDLGCILKKYKEFHDKRFTKRLIEDTAAEGRYRLSIRLLCGEND
ncbi:annexin A2-like [Planococcus citri]